ncbi:sulfurtransferase [Bacillus sp. REN10]|uniref:sulfurtransferase n=1 Tax=Bacillus sp. REN10 TaxID=2782541 RepID=UPI00193C0BDD|nr:sulfurtransferase [Bacillus sp. REN10]
MNFIKSIDWLASHVNDPNVCVIDCRFSLADAQAGEKAYMEGHIPGAFYAHLDRHLSGEKKQHGGRHPLPNVEDVQAVFQSFGITEETTVVVYDQGEAMFAGRCWWLLSYLGHSRVYLLDGGFQEWTNRKLPVTQEIPMATPSYFPVNIQTDWLVSIEEVKEAVTSGSSVLIDSRAPERYNGEVEPLDRVPGHIPTAVNYFFQDGLQGTNWKEQQQQITRFRELDANKSIIVYCGSGVSATPNIIALKEAGFRDVKLYAGSYSDWSSYEDLPVEKKNER